eukprot:1139803-Pelagomonas_calceolata.AAC.1
MSVPRVHSLNISPHCPQPAPEIISKLLNRNRSALPHSLHKGITAPQALESINNLSSSAGRLT